MRRAAGLLIRSQRGRYLLLLRSNEVNDPGVWAAPGGRVESGETPRAAALREAYEEIGSWRLYTLPEPVFIWLSPGFEYWTFVAASLDGEFEPILNWENDGYVWAPKNIVLSGEIADRWVHPGVVRAIENAP